MTKKQIIITLIILLVVISILFYVFGGSKKTSASIYPLTLGYKGEIIKDIQRKLNRIDPTIKLQEDGVLGVMTKMYLEKFASYPLTEQGYADLTLMAA